MPKIFRFGFNDEDREAENRQTSSLAGLAVTLAVLVACVFVMQGLHRKSVIEDCLLAGRPNCNSLVDSLHGRWRPLDWRFFRRLSSPMRRSAPPPVDLAANCVSLRPK